MHTLSSHYYILQLEYLSKNYLIELDAQENRFRLLENEEETILLRRNPFNRKPSFQQNTNSNNWIEKELIWKHILLELIGKHHLILHDSQLASREHLMSSDGFSISIPFGYINRIYDQEKQVYYRLCDTIPLDQLIPSYKYISNAQNSFQEVYSKLFLSNNIASSSLSTPTKPLFKYRFKLCYESYLLDLSDTLIISIFRYWITSTKDIYQLILISKRFKRLFSSDKLWQLYSYPNILWQGRGYLGSESDVWKRFQVIQGLTFYATHRLRWYSHNTSRLKLFYGTLPKSSKYFPSIASTSNTILSNRSLQLIQPMSPMRSSLLDEFNCQTFFHDNQFSHWMEFIPFQGFESFFYPNQIPSQTSIIFNKILILSPNINITNSKLSNEYVSKRFMRQLHYMIPESATQFHMQRYCLPLLPQGKLFDIESSPANSRSRKLWTDPGTRIESNGITRTNRFFQLSNTSHTPHTSLNHKDELLYRRIGDPRLTFLQFSIDCELNNIQDINSIPMTIPLLPSSSFNFNNNPMSQIKCSHSFFNSLLHGQQTNSTHYPHQQTQTIITDFTHSQQIAENKSDWSILTDQTRAYIILLHYEPHHSIDIFHAQLLLMLNIANIQHRNQLPILFLIGIEYQTVCPDLEFADMIRQLIHQTSLFLAPYLWSISWYIQPFNLLTEENNLKQGILTGMNWIIRELMKELEETV